MIGWTNFRMTLILKTKTNMIIWLIVTLFPSNISYPINIPLCESLYFTSQEEFENKSCPKDLIEYRINKVKSLQKHRLD